MLESLGIINLGVFVVGTVLIILMPGPNSLYVLATATRRGVGSGYKAATAVVIGDSVLMLLASLGVDSVMRLYPLAFTLLQYAGAAYLGYLGIRLLLGAVRGGASGNGGESNCPRESPFKKALVLSLSNPKAILFFMSFFVQFVDPAKGHPGVAFLILACIVQVVSITYLSVLIFGGARLARVARNSLVLRKLGSALTGVAFLGFGCRLAMRAAS